MRNVIMSKEAADFINEKTQDQVKVGEEFKIYAVSSDSDYILIETIDGKHRDYPAVPAQMFGLYIDDLRKEIMEELKQKEKRESRIPRIYISGPISGVKNKEECIKRFSEIEQMLTDEGFRVFNPLKNGLPFDAETHRHMRRDLNILTNEEDPFDYIFMMRRWTHSAGCWKEIEDAISCGIAVVFEELPLVGGIQGVTKEHGYAFIRFE